ncbi:MAG: hypothetical protein KC635_23110 [Myxococcales bacterium]|nr:hypothetical protein [Myxococcales bacterium]MCB9732001.1 hypothetical protein [Deltaproteobacteria bacterium]
MTPSRRAPLALPLRLLLLLAPLAAACGSDAGGGASDTLAADTLSADTLTGDTTAVASSCDPASAPLTPAPTADVTYSDWTSVRCLSDKAALCADPAPPTLAGLLRCDAVESGWYWEQGSTAYRVLGRDGDDCVVRVMTEVEGAANLYTCRFPLPMTPWEGLAVAAGGEDADRPLAGVESRCTPAGSCTLIPGAPAEECATMTDRPPLCHLF